MCVCERERERERLCNAFEQERVSELEGEMRAKHKLEVRVQTLLEVRE